LANYHFAISPLPFRHWPSPFRHLPITIFAIGHLQSLLAISSRHCPFDPGDSAAAATMTNRMAKWPNGQMEMAKWPNGK
jgi:hypothetical protein